MHECVFLYTWRADTLEMKNWYGYLNLIDYPGLIVSALCIVIVLIWITCLYQISVLKVHVALQISLWQFNDNDLQIFPWEFVFLL